MATDSTTTAAGAGTTAAAVASSVMSTPFGEVPTEVRGTRVGIRVATVEDQLFLDRLNEHRSHWNASSKKRRTIKEKAEQDALCGEEGGHFIAVRLSDSERIGDVVYKPVRYHPSARAWTVGRELLETARGQGYGTEVMWLMVDWLFTHTDVYRIEGQTDVENVASQRSVEKVGWRREGVLRAAMVRDGRYRDLYSYSILRPEWETLRAARAAALAPPAEAAPAAT